MSNAGYTDNIRLIHDVSVPRLSHPTREKKQDQRY